MLELLELGSLGIGALAALYLASKITPQAVLTYEQVVIYFVRHRPPNARAAKGAILLTREAGSIAVRFLFLDENDEVITDARGRACGKFERVRRLDAELESYFEGGNDLLIVN